MISWIYCPLKVQMYIQLCSHKHSRASLRCCRAISVFPTFVSPLSTFMKDSNSNQSTAPESSRSNIRNAIASWTNIYRDKIPLNVSTRGAHGADFCYFSGAARSTIICHTVATHYFRLVSIFLRRPLIYTQWASYTSWRSVSKYV